MKKMIIALVAMFAMTTSVFAQTNSTVESTSSQVEETQNKAQMLPEDAKDIEVPNYEKLCTFLKADGIQRRNLRPLMQELYASLNKILNHHKGMDTVPMYEQVTADHGKKVGNILTTDQASQYWYVMTPTIKRYVNDHTN